MIVGERDELTLILSNLIEVGEEGVLKGFKGMHVSPKVLLYFPSDHTQVLYHVVSELICI